VRVDVNVIPSPSLDEVEHEVERCHLLVEFALALASSRHGGQSLGRPSAPTYRLPISPAAAMGPGTVGQLAIVVPKAKACWPLEWPARL